MQENSALGRAMEMVRDLRARCAWDRAQTRATLRPYLVEEVLELDHAIGREDPVRIREELSDFLLHLAWQCVLSEELGEATVDQLADDLIAKMQRRHPHLFDLGPAEPWEKLKGRERRGGILDGLPHTLPPLLAAFRLQERAAAVGFDWPDVAGPAAKVAEELAEVTEELGRASPNAEPRTEPRQSTYTEHRPGPAPRQELVDELGDLMFSVVNLARKAGVAPTTALDRANQKFRRRFEQVERVVAERGEDLHDLSLEQLDQLWDEAKGVRGER